MKKLNLKVKTVPRWVVLLCDWFLLVCAFILSYFVAREFEFTTISRRHFVVFTGSYMFCSLVVLFGLRVHNGLLRYSNTRDFVRIFSAMFFLTLAYGVVIFIVEHAGWTADGPKTSTLLFVNFFVGSSSLILLRLAAKNVYHFFMENISAAGKTPALIYGTDLNAIMVKQALTNAADGSYSIIGFVDNARHKLNSYIEQKKVYHIKDLPSLKEKHAVETLMLVNDRLAERDKKVLIERCLRLGIKVLTVPPAEKWASGKLLTQQIRHLRIEDLLQRKPIVINNQGISEALAGKRVLITGAAGSIGSEIVRQVMKYRPSLVILCDNAESPLHALELEIQETEPQANFITAICDIRNKSHLANLFISHRPQLVFHAAAYKHVPMMEFNPREAIQTNVEGTRNVADLSVRYGAEKFVMISTDKAVNPTNVMGASKRIAEIYVQSLNSVEEIDTRFITTRFGNVLGSNGSVIPRFRSQIEKGGPVTVTHPDITRYFMTIPEAVQLVLEAGTMGQGGEIFVFDMGKPVRIADLAENMIRLSGLKPGTDIEIRYTGLRSGEKLYEELLNDAELVLPTHHEKISIARVLEYAFEDVEPAITELIQLNHRSTDKQIVRKMKEIVPEFISRNSPFSVDD